MQRSAVQRPWGFGVWDAKTGDWQKGPAAPGLDVSEVSRVISSRLVNNLRIA